MVKPTAKTVQTSPQPARRVNAVPVPSNARTQTAPHQQQFATVPMTAATAPTNKTATCHALNSNSSVVQTVAASWTVGSATETQTAKMVAMKTQQFATTEPAIQPLNSHARTADAFRNCGCATLITIAVTIPTNQHTCAVNATAQPAGRGVREKRTTDAFRNGCSAMERTTAETAAMSCHRIARHATPIPTSSAAITDAFRNSGCATTLTIAATVQMNPGSFAKTRTGNVVSLSLGAITASAYRPGGAATTKTIVATIPMNSAAVDSSVKTERSSVRLDIASPPISVVTVIAIAGTYQMK